MGWGTTGQHRLDLAGGHNGLGTVICTEPTRKLNINRLAPEGLRRRKVCVQLHAV